MPSAERLRETYSTVDEIGEVIRREGIECGFLKAGALIVATSEPQRQRLLASERAARELGADDDDVRVADTGAGRRAGPGGGLPAPPSTPPTRPASTRAGWCAGWPRHANGWA